MEVRFIADGYEVTLSDLDVPLLLENIDLAGVLFQTVLKRLETKGKVKAL